MFTTAKNRNYTRT